MQVFCPKDVSQGGLGQQPCRVVSVLHICHRDRGVGHPVVDHSVHWHCHWISCQNLEYSSFQTGKRCSGWLPLVEAHLRWLFEDQPFDRFLCTAEQKIFLEKRKRVKHCGMWICLRSKLHSRIPLLCTARENRRCIFTISSIPTISQLQNIGLASRDGSSGWVHGGVVVVQKLDSFPKENYIISGRISLKIPLFWDLFSNTKRCSEEQ